MVQATRLPWRRVLRRTLFLLLIWFTAGPILGILVVDRLNTVVIGDLPLGFWVAQQGSIYVFVILIFLNAWLADRETRLPDALARPAARAMASEPGAAPRTQRDPGV
jgi:putative solute:sodium symporter small subunit